MCKSVERSVLEVAVECPAIVRTRLTECFEHEDPFASLQTEYQQTKFYQEEFGLVVSSLHIALVYYSLTSFLFFVCIQLPVTVKLGSSYQCKTTGAKRSLVEKTESFQYVENLEWLLQHREISNEVNTTYLIGAGRSEPHTNHVCEIITVLTVYIVDTHVHAL